MQIRAALLLALLPGVAAALARPCRVSRRTALHGAAGLATVAARGLPAVEAIEAPPPMVDVPASAFTRISGGGQSADLRIGTGAEVKEGSRVSLQWILRRSNGYYVDGSIKLLSAKSGAVQVGDNFDEKDIFTFTVGDGTAMPGIDQGVRGMRQGGSRRLVLPIKQAYTLPVDKSPGPVPDGYGPRQQITRELQRSDPYNYFYFEVEATRVR